MGKAPCLIPILVTKKNRATISQSFITVTKPHDEILIWLTLLVISPESESSIVKGPVGRQNLVTLVRPEMEQRYSVLESMKGDRNTPGSQYHFHMHTLQHNFLPPSKGFTIFSNTTCLQPRIQHMEFGGHPRCLTQN